MDLTRIKADGHKISSGEMVNMLFEQKNYECLLIKIFDRLHNMRTIMAKSSEKIKKTIEKTVRSFITLAFYLGIPEIEQELTQLISHTVTQEELLLQEQYVFSFNDNAPLLSLIF